MQKYKKIKLDDFKNNSKKKNLRGHFWEPSDELLNIIWFVLIEYVFCEKIILRLMWEGCKTTWDAQRGITNK